MTNIVNRFPCIILAVLQFVMRRVVAGIGALSLEQPGPLSIQTGLKRSDRWWLLTCLVPCRRFEPDGEEMSAIMLCCSWEVACTLRACHRSKPLKIALCGEMTLRTPMSENLVVGITAYVVSSSHEIRRRGKEWRTRIRQPVKSDRLGHRGISSDNHKRRSDNHKRRSMSLINIDKTPES